MITYFAAVLGIDLVAASDHGHPNNFVFPNVFPFPSLSSFFELAGRVLAGIPIDTPASGAACSHPSSLRERFDEKKEFPDSGPISESGCSERYHFPCHGRHHQPP